MAFEPLIICGLYLSFIMLLGYVVLCTVLKPGTRHWAELAGLCFAAGAGTIELLLFMVSLAGFKPSRMILIVIAGSCLILLAILKGRSRLIRPTLPGARKKIDGTSVIAGLAAIAIIAGAFNVQAHANWPGLGDIDAFAIWMFKAKWVALSPLRPMPAAFWDPALSYSHQDYPLGLPFLLAGLYSVAGHVDDSLARSLLLPQYLALVGVIYSAVRAIHRRAMAIIIVAVFVAAPVLVQNGGLVVAETPLVLAYTAALVMLLQWIDEGSDRALIMVGIFMATAAFTKNEGLALLPVMGGISLLVTILSPRKVGNWILAVGISLALVSPWLVFRTFLPRTHEDYGGKLRSSQVLFNNLPRLPQILPGFLGQMFDPLRAGPIWYVLIAATIIGYRRVFSRTSLCTLWVLLAIQLGLYTATFIVTPWNIGVLMNMIGPKLLVQASPVAVLLIAMLLPASVQKSDGCVSTDTV